MPEFATLARPYANALFEVSKINLINYSNSLKTVSLITSNKDFRLYSNDPLVTKKMLLEFIFGIIKKDEGNEFKNFIKVLTDNSRLFVLKEIFFQYKNLMNANNGIKKIRIVTAFKLTEKELNILLKKLEVKFKTKFEPEVKVDPSLLGGVRIEIGDQVLDGSVRSKINRLKSSLLT